jgi:hypothetical protein
MNKNYSFVKTNLLSILKTSRTQICFYFILFLFTNTITAQVFDSTPGTKTFTVPCDVTSLTVKVWGAGGAGGGSSSNNNGGSGGGAGGYATAKITVGSGQSIIYTVGSGGTGSSGSSGTNGGNTTFLTLSANGGVGGNLNTGAGGVGGTASGGTTNTAGGSGGIGGGNTGGNGGNASSGGSGGAGNNNGNGLDGNAPGGGGGGGERGGGSNRSGGNGGNGRIEITYVSSYCMPVFSNGVEPITNVTFAGIKNSTVETLGGFSLESFCAVGTVAQGSATNPISIKGNTNGFSAFIRVYFDWDQNGVFGNVANEIYDLGTLATSTGIDATKVTANISVPVTASLGTTRMRVMKTYYTATGPCQSGSDWGQAEDYVINVQLPIPVTSFSPSAVCAGSPITITGSNFIGVTTVTVNDVAVASFTVNSSTSITATLAVGNTSGLVKVSKAGSIGASASSLSVNTTPTITISPIASTMCANTIQKLSATTTTSLDAIIGSDTTINDAETTSNTSYPAPYGAYYENVKQQYLILASELTASGLTTGSVINNLTFDVTTLGTSGMHSGYTISMGNTIQSAMTTWENGLTTVFEPVNYQPISGANTHNFSKSFVWDGTSNIIVQVCHTNDVTNSGNKYTSNARSRYSTTTFNSSLTYRVDNTDACGSSSISYTQKKRPNMIFGAVVAPAVTWLPTTNLFTDASGTIAYTGTNLATVYARPAADVIYTAKATAASGCSNTATANLIVSNITNTWNGSVWSTGFPPVNTDKLVFAGTYPPVIDPNVDIVGCSCQISGGATVTIKPGRTLTIVNDVKVNGTLIFEDTASLVQINDGAVNSGNITYKRQTTAISNLDFTYWSSPVSPQKLYDVSPNTTSDKFFSFDAVADNWKQENSVNNMVKGIGYIIRGPQSHAAPIPPKFYQASFIGVPNNGVVSIPAVVPVIEASYLLGNPYPSALDADLFLKSNIALLEGTLYFWTHNTSIQKASAITNGTAGSGAYAYTSDDYASYNLTGGTATAIGAAGINTNVPNGKIASGQAFFATTKTTGTIIFNNSMRIGGNNNTQFFKFSAKSKESNTIEKNRVWLDLYNSQGAFKQTLIGYVKGATNDYDNIFDGESFDANEFIDFYSVNKNKNLVIQGRAIPFDEADEVALGYKTNIEGDFSIAISQTDGLFAAQNIFIEDKLLNIVHDLKNGTYNFTTENGTFNERFVLRYTNKTLAIDDFDDVKNGVLVSSKNKEIQIKSSDELIDKVVVFDFSGRQLYSKTKIAASDYKIQTLIPTDQGLIVKVVLQNGQIVSKKIIF